MNQNRLLQQVTAIFSAFMVMFYIGVGVFFIWYSDTSNIDKPVRVLLGSAFLLYGAFRAIRAFVKIREVFGPVEKNEEEDRGRYRRGGQYKQ